MAEKVETDVVTSESSGNSQNEGDGNSFDITKCVCQSVIVYLDRAEVCRSMETSLQKGENEVILTNLSNFLDTDSVRVEGKGPATISEVSFQTRHLTPKEETKKNNDKASELRELIEEKRTQEGILQTKRNRLEKQRRVIDNFADSVSKAPSYDSKGDPKGGSGGGIPLNPETFDGMNTFFELYEKHAKRLDDAIFEVQQELKALVAERGALEKNLQEIRPRGGKREARVLSILLDATEDAKVALSVSYVVSQAKWTPKYDIRVFSNDQQMKITYYGMIQQSTGEDWDNAKLSLSTAMPSIGGTVPQLGTQKLQFKPKIYYTKQLKGGFFRSSKRERRPVSSQSFGMTNSLSGSGFDEEEDQHESFCPMEEPVAEVKDSITSAVFEIARLTSIPADNVQHKVSVAIIDFKPDFQFECVPKKSTFAFLKAKVKNTSQYALLAGPSNIFLDNNFISKAEVKGVSPGEEFDCSLGIDATIKVTYKPVHKFREQTGLWNKSQVIKYRQEIEVKNNHQYQVKFMLTEQLPLSTEDKIKVHLTEPVIKKESPERGDDKPAKNPDPIRINKDNNVEWNLVIPAGAKKDILLKYTVEHPVNEELEVLEIPASN